jgi:DNA-binding NtrC family response regulator
VSTHKILVIDDDPVIRFGICDFLRKCDYQVTEAATVREGQHQFQNLQPDAAVVDSLLPDGTSFEILEWMENLGACIPVFILTSPGAKRATIPPSYGGTAYLFDKPVALQVLKQQLDRALEGERLRRQSKSAPYQSWQQSLDPFLGTSAAIRHLAQLANRLLTSESPLFLQGETGSGKGVLANWIHNHGTRAGESFHDLNCAGLSRELLESELFGHRRGSFTGAVENKLGLFEAANHGTLFLDEIGDIDLHVQSKLLKAVEERRFRRLGEVRERMVDVRLISATRCNLEKLMEEGRFRDDLYYRINVVPITIPPLRERSEDIPLLARYLIDRLCHECGRKPMSIEDSALDLLRRHRWPGNIRELRNALERAIQLSERSSLTTADFQLERRCSTDSKPPLSSNDFSLTLRQVEENHIEMVLQEEGGSVERAARRLGIARSSLYNRLKSPLRSPTATA